MDTDPQTPAVDAPPAREDATLLAKLRARDEAAFASLIDRHHGALRRLARMFVSSDASAEEVVQDTWLAVLGGLGAFEGRSSLKTWIFRILVNRARTRGVREGRSVPFSALERDDEPGGEPAVDPGRFNAQGMWSAPPQRWEDATPEKLVLRQETGAFLVRALNELPERQRAVVALRDVDGWTSEEVCNVLGISETNQRVLLHRARARLRTALERHLAKG